MHQINYRHNDPDTNNDYDLLIDFDFAYADPIQSIVVEAVTIYDGTSSGIELPQCDDNWDGFAKMKGLQLLNRLRNDDDLLDACRKALSDGNNAADIYESTRSDE